MKTSIPYVIASCLLISVSCLLATQVCFITKSDNGTQTYTHGSSSCSSLGTNCIPTTQTVYSAPMGPGCKMASAGLTGCSQTTVSVTETIEDKQCQKVNGQCSWVTVNSRTVPITAIGQIAAGQFCPTNNTNE